MILGTLWSRPHPADGDAVPGFEGSNGGVHSEDGAGGFVAKDVCVFDNHGANAALAGISITTSSCLYMLCLREEC